MDKVDNPSNWQPLRFRGPVLGILAKQPRVGRVKTRLIPPLTPHQARDLYRVALVETVAACADVPVTRVLCGAGRRRWFSTTFPDVLFLPQGRGDLGARLQRLVATLFAAGATTVAVAGSDSPDLPPVLINAAFAALATADVVVVPCVDGGYALLALRRPVPELFTQMPWSTSEVLACTRARAVALGLRFMSVGGWDDLDDFPSLHRLLARSPECATAQHVRRHLGQVLCSGCG